MHTSDQSVTDYFLYVKNVLGVKTLQSSSIRETLQNPLRATQTGPSVESCDLLFLNIRKDEAASPFDGEARALADKMIQAMRLGSRKFLYKEVSGAEYFHPEVDPLKVLQTLAESVDAPFVVLFSSQPKSQGLIQNLGAQKFLETFGPHYLMNHPQAKKVAWLDLQKVMKELGIS